MNEKIKNRIFTAIGGIIFILAVWKIIDIIIMINEAIKGGL